MTTSFVSSEFVEANNLTMPSHQAGDLLIAVASRTSIALMSLPSGWSQLIYSNIGGRVLLVAFKIATSSSETSGTWTNAELLGVAVYRDDANCIVPGSRNGNSSISSSNINYPAITNQRSSWVVGICSVSSNSLSAETAPSGMTNRDSIAGGSIALEIAIHDTNSNASSWSSTNVAPGGTIAYASYVFEIFDTGASKSSGGSSRPVLPFQQQVIG